MRPSPMSMGGEPVSHSRFAWKPALPDTVVICCVDGRWRQHIEEFIQRHLGVALADVFAVPGGIEPLTLIDTAPEDFNFMRRRLEALLQSRDTRRIVAIAHEDCAWYQQRQLGRAQLDVQEEQRQDLRCAAALLQQLFPAIAVETYFARLVAGATPTVAFEAV